MTNEERARLAEIQAECEAATPGEWETKDRELHLKHEYDERAKKLHKQILEPSWEGEVCTIPGRFLSPADAIFCANAKRNILWLIEFAERLYADLEVEHGRCERLFDGNNTQNTPKMDNVLDNKTAKNLDND